MEDRQKEDREIVKTKGGLVQKKYQTKQQRKTEIDSKKFLEK